VRVLLQVYIGLVGKLNLALLHWFCTLHLKSDPAPRHAHFVALNSCGLAGHLKAANCTIWSTGRAHSLPEKDLTPSLKSLEYLLIWLVTDGPRHMRTARDSQHGDAIPGIGIEHETSEALLDGGEGAREEKTALAVSNDRKLIESREGDEIALFEGVGTEAKLLGGEKQADVGKASSLALKGRKGALGKEWEDEIEPLEEDEISVHKVDGAVLDVADEEAIREEKEGLDGEKEDELDVGIKTLAHNEDPAKDTPKKEHVAKGKKEAPKRKSGHSSCDPHFASSEKALAEPAADTRRFEDFKLRYVGAEERGQRVDAGKVEEWRKGVGVKKFNGRQTWEERNESFRIKVGYSLPNLMGLRWFCTARRFRH
jgi:hypothetical protein